MSAFLITKIKYVGCAQVDILSRKSCKKHCNTIFVIENTYRNVVKGTHKGCSGGTDMGTRIIYSFFQVQISDQSETSRFKLLSFDWRKRKNNFSLTNPGKSIVNKPNFILCFDPPRVDFSFGIILGNNWNQPFSVSTNSLFFLKIFLKFILFNLKE